MDDDHRPNCDYANTRVQDLTKRPRRSQQITLIHLSELNDYCVRMTIGYRVIPSLRHYGSVAIDIGSGLGIDELSGEMTVIDPSRVDTDLANSPDPCNRAVAALVRGDFDQASAELDAAPPTFRRAMLRGEHSRLTGHADRAIDIFTKLLWEYSPDGLRRAVLLQHLAKAENTSGNQPAASQHLEEVLGLRLQYRAPPDQIASTRLMLEIVRCM